MTSYIRGTGAVEMDVVIAADEKVVAANDDRSAMPSGWYSRALYPGQTGYRNWLGVVQEAGYPLRDPKAFGLHDHRLAAIRGRNVGTLVSLGPGDGTADADLVAALQPKHEDTAVGREARRLMYIPVEISRPLLESAIAHLRPYADIPVGVLADFEEGEGVLSSTLEVYAVRPVLLAMLGGTVGNLDRGEPAFFAAVRRWMHPGDAFLLDVPLAGPAWSASEDPRLDLRSYSTAFRQFLGGAIHADHPQERAGRWPAEAHFEHWALLAHRHDDATAAEVITVADRESGRLILTFRRYHWGGILRWFRQQGFDIAYAQSSADPRFGMGVVLLTPA